TTPSAIAHSGLMYPAAGVIPTQPTMIAVAAPIAVTCRARIRSSTNQVASAQAGVSRVFTNASTPALPTENPLPPLKPNQPNHSEPPALEDRPRHQRGGDDAERRLEGEEQQARDVRPLARGEVDVVQEGVAEAADEAVALIERERVAHDGPHDRRHRERGDAH